MNNEIKEILDNLDFIINHTSNWIVPLALNQESWKLLLDYITKLQEDVRTGQEIIGEYKQENERLKKDYYEEYDIHLKDKTYYFNLFEDYKSRCEKAIEYINDHIRIDDEYPDYMEMLIEERDNLLNILQNGSDSQ